MPAKLLELNTAVVMLAYLVTQLYLLFYPNKQMTTGEGGMIVTDDEERANLFRSLRNQGARYMSTPGLSTRVWATIIVWMR